MRACRPSAARWSHVGPIWSGERPRRRPPRAGVERTFPRARMGGRPCRARTPRRRPWVHGPDPIAGMSNGGEWCRPAVLPARAGRPTTVGSRPSHDGRACTDRHTLRVPFARRRRGREEWRTRGRMMATGLRSAGNPASATATAARRPDLGPLPVGISYAGIRPAAARRPDRGPLPVGISYGPRPMLPREAPRRHRVSRSTGPLGLNFTISLD